MTAMGIPANAKQLAVLVKEGKGPALEFKRSTGERHDSKPVNQPPAEVPADPGRGKGAEGTRREA